MKKTLRLALDILMIAVCALVIARTVEDVREQAEIRAVVDYLAENTEDAGDYVISVYPAESRFAEHPDTKFYFADMIDSDGDYERVVVAVRGDDIHEVGLN